MNNIFKFSGGSKQSKGKSTDRSKSKGGLFKIFRRSSKRSASDQKTKRLSAPPKSAPPTPTVTPPTATTPASASPVVVPRSAERVSRGRSAERAPKDSVLPTAKPDQKPKDVVEDKQCEAAVDAKGSGGAEKSDAKSQMQFGFNQEDARWKWAQRQMQPGVMTRCTKKYTSKTTALKATEALLPHKVFDENSRRNRYYDIPCLDETRVVLKERDEGHDYIHANWVKLPDDYRYICTQGPLTASEEHDDTREDFWHMCYSEGVKCIVMIGGFVEDEQVKCGTYFPQNGGTDQYGLYKITVIEKVDVSSEIQQTKIEVKREGGDAIVVEHFLMGKWLDHSCPKDVRPYMETLKQVRDISQGSPAVIHCSAGVGRSGTLIAIDYASIAIEKDCNTDLMNVVLKIRSQRLGCVQAPLQYLLLNFAPLVVFLIDKVIPRDEAFIRTEKEFVSRQEACIQKVHKAYEKRRSLEPDTKSSGKDIKTSEKKEKRVD